MATRLSEVVIASDGDVVTAGQRARQLARVMGFPKAHSTRIATAFFEIARNVVRYAGQGQVAFMWDAAAPRRLSIHVSDTGPGIAELAQILESDATAPGAPFGIVGSRRLMDAFSIDSKPGTGTQVTMAMELPPEAPDPPPLEAMQAALEASDATDADDPYAELRRRNRTLLELLTDLDAQRRQLAAANAELKRANAERERLLVQERVAREAAEAAQRESVRAVAAREDILHVVSHDLRSPLNALRLSASVLERMARTGLEPDKVGRIASAAMLSCNRMERLLRDLLDFGAIERGHLRVQRVTADVVAVLDEVVAEMRPVAAEETVEIIAERPSPPVLVDCDRDRIVQILQNLVANAIRFTPGGGRVSVRLSADPREVRFEVADQGPGIPDEQLPHIFERYYHNGTRGPSGRLGLGLAIALALVRAHSGAIWAESAKGGGSTFVFTLPCTMSAHDTVEIPAIDLDYMPPR